MFVRSRMTPDPVTVSPEQSIFEALRIMRDNSVRRLPVVRNGKLVGIVTELDLLRVSPSEATSLSVWEMNYVLSKMRVKDVMTDKVVVISPEATIEEAAVLMRENVISGLPVVEGGKLVGIITETNLFDAFIDTMGLYEKGVRLTLAAEDHPGVLAEITGIVARHGVNIISLATFHGRIASRPDAGEGNLVLRIATTEPEVIIGDLNKAGHRVVHVTAMPGAADDNGS